MVWWEYTHRTAIATLDKSKVNVVVKTGSLFVSRLMSVAIQSVCLLLASRISGISEYGQFVYVWGLALIGSAFVSFGGSGVLLRALPTIVASDLSHFALGVISRVIGRSLLMFALISVAAYSVPNFILIDVILLDIRYLLLCLELTFLTTGVSLIGSILRQTHGASVFILVKEVAPWSFFLVWVVTSPEHTAANSLLLALVVSFLMALVIGLILLGLWSLKHVSDIDWKIYEPHPSEKFGWFSVSGAVAALAANLDIVLARLILGTEAVGIYSILKRATSLLGISQNVANLLISKRVVELNVQNNLVVLQQLLVKAFYLAFIPSAILGLILFSFSKVWLGWFEIENSQVNTLTLTIALLAAGFNVFCGANVLLASQFGKERSVVFARVGSLACIVIGVPLFGQLFGIVGVAICFLSQAVAMNVFVTLKMYRSTGLWTSIPLKLGIRG